MPREEKLLIGVKTEDGDLRKLRRELDKTRGSVKSLQSVGSKMQSVGKSLTAGFTLPMLAMAGAAVKASVDFNRSMANVATLIPGNTKRIAELKKGVQDLSVEMGSTTSDMTGGLYQVISAFGDTADTMAVLEVNAKAAKGGLASVTDAINLTSAVTKGYGDTSAAAVEKAADLALLTVRLGQTTFPELAGSIGRVTPIAAALGVSVEELYAGFATLTGVTGSAAEVSTQHRGILAALMKPTDAMAGAIDKLGFKSSKALIEQMGMVGALQALIKTTDGTTESVSKLFGNVEALPAVFAYAGGQADTYTQKLGEMEKGLGTNNEAFREQTEGINKVGFAWDQAKAKLEVTAQRMGDALAPGVTSALEQLDPFITKVGNLAQGFADLDPEMQGTILKIAAFAVALPPAVAVAGSLLKVLAGIKTAALFLAANPITISFVVAGLAGLAAGYAMTRYLRGQAELQTTTGVTVSPADKARPVLPGAPSAPRSSEAGIVDSTDKYTSYKNYDPDAFSRSFHHTGTDYVPRTGLYRLMQGERVSKPGSSSNVSFNVTVNAPNARTDDDIGRVLESRLRALMREANVRAAFS